MLKVTALAIVALLALSLGTYASVSALGGDSTPSPTPEPSVTPAPSPDADPGENDDGDDDDQDEADDADDESADDEASDATGQGSTDKAALIAEAFGVPESEVIALREQGIGWGAIVKLLQLAAATGQSAADVAATHEGDGGGFAFGQQFNALEDDQRPQLDSLPRNLGEIVSGKNAGQGQKNRD